MKYLNDIYNSIVNKFTKKTGLELSKGSAIDSYILASANAIEDAYIEIENNKNPHLFTNLKGSDIDSMGMLVGCARQSNETDSNYLYRMISWNTSNQASNSIAIDSALQNMTNASTVTYVPFTMGVGTATAYIIPKKLDLETINLAIAETKNRLTKVVSKSSYVEYIVPTMLPINMVAYISILKDENNVKKNINDKIESYINNIAPGDYIDIGVINKIGVNETNVSYFSIAVVTINGKEFQDLTLIQKLEEKFLFNEIIWKMVVSK